MTHPFDSAGMADENRGSGPSVPSGGGDARGFDAGGFRGRLSDARGFEARGHHAAPGDRPGGPGGPDETSGVPVNGSSAIDEFALRRLLHDAVRDVGPRADALDRLRHAVPARRTRRRQAMVGAAAGVLLMGTAVPALVHAADSAGTDSSTTANASSSHGSGSAPGTQGGTAQGGGASGPAGEGGTGGRPGIGWSGGAPPSASASASAGGSPTDAAAAAPACTRDQLGDGSAQVAAADSAGRVYGTFTVVNTSTTSCSVTGEGRITVTGQGGVDATGIRVVDHTAGDPADGLPAPAATPAAVVLAPGKAYQVQFAWIPSSAGTTGCTPASGGTTGSTGSGGTTGTSTTGSGGTSSGTAGTANAPTSGGSPSASPVSPGITLTHIPQAGDPGAVSTTLAGACAGTVYRTAVLAVP